MTESFDFDRVLSLTSTGDDTFQAQLDAGWTMNGTVVAGGYLFALTAQAARMCFADKPDPIASSAHFLAVCLPGEATLRVRRIKEGKLMATAAVDLIQGGETRVSSIVTCTDMPRLAAGAGDFAQRYSRRPELGPTRDLPVSHFALEEGWAPMYDKVHLHPSSDQAVIERDRRDGTVRAMARFADGREPDPISLIMLCDTLPPVSYGAGLTGWAPTIQMSVQLRAAPAKGWLTIEHSAHSIKDGVFDEDCLIWDSSGHLVAQSRQLALQPKI
jgi:Thioesterase-like superfamily